MNEDTWFKLDTAAKVYPAIISPEQANVFRLSCTLNEDIRQEILSIALEITLQRYPSICVTMKKGAFWFYFETNMNRPKVRPELSYPCQMVDIGKNRRFLFRCNFYGRRINLEFFHVVTDATGGIEFLKTLVFYYLQLRGFSVSPDGLIKTLADPLCDEETENSFLRYYDPVIKADRGSKQRAFHFRGTPLPFPQTRAVHAQLSAKALLDLVHQQQVTITEYLTAVFIQAYFRAVEAPKNLKEMVIISVPVNLRKPFPSQTLRNFTFFINVGESFEKKDQAFPVLLEKIKTDFRAQNCKEIFLPRMNPNVSAESNPVMRAAPIQMKQVVLKQAHHIIGDNLFTCSFSNLGVVNVSPLMEPYIQRFDFGLSTSEKIPLNLSMCTFRDQISMTFSASIREKAIEKEFLRFLVLQGLEVTIETSGEEDNE